MAELPRVAREIAVTPRVESRVSAADIAAPYNAIAKGLSGIGSFLSDWQRMSEDGVVATQIDAAKTAALQFQNDANGNVDAFKTSWKTYQDAQLASVPTNRRATFEANLVTIGGNTERSLLGDKFKRDQEIATNQVTARQKTLEADLADLAQQGLTGSADYEAKHSELTTMLNEKAGNPAFAYSPANLDADVSRIEDTLTGAAVTGELQRVYAKDGYAAAQKRAQEIYDDSKSTLPVVKRLKAIQAGLSSVRSLYEADSQARRDFSANAQQVKAALADGSLAPDDPLVADMMGQADSLKDPVSKLALQTAQATARLNPMKGLGLHDRLDFITGGPSGFVRGSANAAKPGPLWGTPGTPDFEGQHLTTIKTPSGQSVTVNKVAATAFTGFLGDLDAAGYKISDVQGYDDRSKLSGGPSQHAFGNAIDVNPDQNPANYTPLLGPKDFKTNLPANVADIAAKWGITWGGDWKSLKDPMHFEFAGVPTSATVASNGGASAATTGGLAGYVKGAVPAQKAIIKDGLDLALTDATTIVGKHPLNESQIADLVDAARIVDDADHYSKVASVIAQSDATAAVLGTPASDHTALLDLMRAPGPAGDEAVRIKAFDAAQATHNAMAEKLKADPRGLGVELGLFAPGPVVNWGDLKGAGATLNRRASEMSRLENTEGQAPNSLTVLRPDETVALKAAWAGGTVEQKAALLAALSDSLPPERMMAVLSGLGGEKGAPRMLAIAGALAVTSPAASRAIIRGQAALATNPKFGFDEGTADDRQKVSDVFPPSIVPPGPGYLQGWQDHVDAAKAVYAEMSATAGDASGKFSEQRWKDAVRTVTGGILEYRGQKIIAPVPGMSQGDFEKLLLRATAPANGVAIVNGVPTDVGAFGPLARNAFRGAEWPDGSPLTADQVRDLGVLHSSGDGRYVIELGKGSGVIAQQRLSTDSAIGRVIAPFELNLKALATAPQQPARVQDYVPPPAPAKSTEPTLPPTVSLDKAREIIDSSLKVFQRGGSPSEAFGALDEAIAKAIAKGDLTKEEAEGLRDFWRRSITPTPSTGNRPQGSLEQPRGPIQVADASGAIPQSAKDQFNAAQGGVRDVSPEQYGQLPPASLGGKPQTAQEILDHFKPTKLYPNPSPIEIPETSPGAQQFIKSLPDGYGVYRLRWLDQPYLYIFQKTGDDEVPVASGARSGPRVA